MQATIEPTGIPDALAPHFDKLKKAFAEAYPMTWSGEDDADGIKYLDAAQPAAIGAVLVGAIHRHLRNRSIGYLYRENIKRHDKVILGKAAKVGAKLRHFANHEFMIEINWQAWGGLSARQRIALIDHELSHFGIEETENGSRCVLLSHDVEEFGAIVQRWGLWMPDLAAFAKFTQQLDMWTEPAPPKIDDDGVESIQQSAMGADPAETEEPKTRSPRGRGKGASATTPLGMH